MQPIPADKLHRIECGKCLKTLWESDNHPPENDGDIVRAVYGKDLCEETNCPWRELPTKGYSNIPGIICPPSEEDQ